MHLEKMAKQKSTHTHHCASIFFKKEVLNFINMIDSLKRLSILSITTIRKCEILIAYQGNPPRRPFPFIRNPHICVHYLSKWKGYLYTETLTINSVVYLLKTWRVFGKREIIVMLKINYVAAQHFAPIWSDIIVPALQFVTPHGGYNQITFSGAKLQQICGICK